jgi:hypothetical protein
MQQPKAPQEKDDDDRGGAMGNVALLLFFAAVIGIGVWLVNALVAQRDTDNCVAQGRRNCTSLDLPAR